MNEFIKTHPEVLLSTRSLETEIVLVSTSVRLAVLLTSTRHIRRSQPGRLEILNCSCADSSVQRVFQLFIRTSSSDAEEVGWPSVFEGWSSNPVISLFYPYRCLSS